MNSFLGVVIKIIISLPDVKSNVSFKTNFLQI